MPQVQPLEFPSKKEAPSIFVIAHGTTNTRRIPTFAKRSPILVTKPVSPPSAFKLRARTVQNAMLTISRWGNSILTDNVF